jgi:hypothetical protein
LGFKTAMVLVETVEEVGGLEIAFLSLKEAFPLVAVFCPPLVFLIPKIVCDYY